MQIELWKNFAKENNSTKRPSTVADYTRNVVLKDNCSILAPVFILNGVNYEVNYVKWNNRYYFISDIIAVSKDVAEYHCNIDVLATYKTQIGSSTQYVIRSAADFDTHVIDNAYPGKSGLDFTISSIPDALEDFSNSTFVMSLVNADSGASLGGISYYILTPSEMGNVMEYMYSNDWFELFDHDEPEDYFGEPIESFKRLIQKAFIDPIKYVIRIMWFPFNINIETSETVSFGGYETTLTAPVITPAQRKYYFSYALHLPQHPQIERGKYLNGNPFTRRILNFFTFGSIPIDCNEFVDTDTLFIDLVVDLFTGIGQLQVRGLLPDGPIGVLNTATSDVAVNIPITQFKSDVQSATSNLFNAATGIAGGTAGGVLGSTLAIGSAFESMLPQIRTVGNVGTTVAYSTVPTILNEFTLIADEDNTHKGRPLMKKKLISSLPGYNVCSDVDIDIACTQSEYDQIKSYLESGFYYE